MSIAIIVLTHNKRQLLAKCVENVLLRTSEATREIVIWNNASVDGTGEYLDLLDDPRIRLINHPKNIGQNAYAKAYPLTSASHIVELDDDVIEAPWHWDETLLTAFRCLPTIGFLAANLIEDEHDPSSRAMYGKNRDLYRIITVNGVKLKTGGPIGGGCAMISRKIHDEVGGFPVDRKRSFFPHDAAFTRKIRAAGYETAYLEELKVFHAGGKHYSGFIPPEKSRYWEERERTRKRKNAIKRVLLAMPLVPSLNARFEWFQPPETTRTDTQT
jgi:GT2 family glycosyltransferase